MPGAKFFTWAHAHCTPLTVNLFHLFHLFRLFHLFLGNEAQNPPESSRPQANARPVIPLHYPTALRPQRAQAPAQRIPQKLLWTSLHWGHDKSAVSGSNVCRYSESLHLAAPPHLAPSEHDSDPLFQFLCAKNQLQCVKSGSTWSVFNSFKNAITGSSKRSICLPLVLQEQGRPAGQGATSSTSSAAFHCMIRGSLGTTTNYGPLLPLFR